MALIRSQSTNLTAKQLLCIPRYWDSPPISTLLGAGRYPQCSVPNRRKILQSRHNRESITDPRLRWDARCGGVHQSTMTKFGAPWKSRLVLGPPPPTLVHHALSYAIMARARAVGRFGELVTVYGGGWGGLYWQCAECSNWGWSLLNNRQRTQACKFAEDHREK